MVTTSSVFGTTPETIAVMRKLQGHRTVADIVCRFFGFQKEDLIKAEKLKKMGLKYHDRLGELGVSKEAFVALFEDVLPKEYFDGDKKRGAQEGSETVSSGSEESSGLDNPKWGTKAGKKK